VRDWLPDGVGIELAVIDGVTELLTEGLQPRRAPLRSTPPNGACEAQASGELPLMDASESSARPMPSSGIPELFEDTASQYSAGCAENAMLKLARVLESNTNDAGSENCPYEDDADAVTTALPAANLIAGTRLLSASCQSSSSTLVAVATPRAERTARLRLVKANTPGPHSGSTSSMRKLIARHAPPDALRASYP
jgi:hypothetical protein